MYCYWNAIKSSVSKKKLALTFFLKKTHSLRAVWQRSLLQQKSTRILMGHILYLHWELGASKKKQLFIAPIESPPESL
jgi:hypothetical protein